MSVPLVRAINLRSLDVLRGLVATYVLLGHARWLLWTGHAAWIKLQHSLAANVLAYASVTVRYGHEAVMIFFVLSGFFIHLRVAPALVNAVPFTFKPLEFLRRRAHRLLAPYLFALLVTFVADMTGRHFFPTLYVAHTGNALLDSNFSCMGYSLVSVLPALVFLPSSLGHDFGTNGPLWSLAYEIIYYLLYPAWLCLRRLGLTAGYGLGVGLWVLALWGPFVPFVSAVLAHYPVWLAGAAMAEILSIGFQFHRAYVPIVAAVAALAGFVVINLSLPLSVEIIAYIFFGSGAVGVFASFPESFSISRVHRICEELGIRGYSIYILHFPLLALISAWAIDRLGGRPVSGWLAAGGGMAVLGLCLLGFHLCERHFLHARLRPALPQ